ncbi:clathrin light chain isoform X4 [Neocloeon triangulifer]|uniref:clathrin light chain isoform X4 n=1 Tax=Neocloeon triangulifer TaxID=2078957 RepID=UPI00286EF61C|nr:clathrin light chain isoform X4 [Neocloeon triangulifer]
MDAFGDDEFVSGSAEVDPAAEFLAREQDQLAGLEDELEPISSAPNPLPEESELESKPEEVNGYEEPAASVSPKVAKEEPEKIRKWREEQKQRLEEKDAAEAEAIEKLRLQAREELDEWYKNHNEAKTKTKAANRESAMNAEKQFVAATDEIEPGTEWERIAKLCDFNPKSSKGCKDVTRMRSIILQLKQTPLPSKS